MGCLHESILTLEGGPREEKPAWPLENLRCLRTVSGLWTSVNGRSGRAKPKPETGVPGRACHRQGPGMRSWLWVLMLLKKTPQTITSYLAKAHFFQSLKTRSTERRKRILWKEGEAEARVLLQVGPAAGWSLGGLPLEMAASLTRCPRTYCSIVVFTGPRMCLLSPGRRTRHPCTTEGGFLQSQLALRLGL